MRTLLWLMLGTAGIYGLVGALMYAAQRSLMYFPETLRTAPAAAGFPRAEEIVLDTADGERVIAWHVAPAGSKPVVLYFHGNGGALRYRVARFKALTADGTGLLALSYRGYGGSSGRPTEAGLLADGAAAYRFAAARYTASRLVLWGESLGSAVAVALAAQNTVAGLTLEAPFTSATDVGARAYWFMPVRLLLKDRFHSDRRAGQITAPVLVMHGARDEIVPIEFGEKLYDLITAPKRFVRFADGHHNDLDAYGATSTVREFLVELQRERARGVAG